MRKLLTMCFALLLCSVKGSAVNVVIDDLKAKDVSKQMIDCLQANLGRVLTEINNAYSQHRAPSMVGLPMNEYAKRMLVTMWGSARYYCDDEELYVDEFYPLRNGYLLRKIPVILSPNDKEFKENYQEMIVEFDKQGTIVDFRLALPAWQAESMKECGVASVERAYIMEKFVEQFRTAYCTKDIDFLNKIFSDDALIVTGKVIATRASDIDKGNLKVVYNRQNKQQYLANLKRTFIRNKYVDVKFEKYDMSSGGGCPWLTQSKRNPNFYGVRLRQEWHSSNYSDEGIVFLLWDFTNEDEPVIHVRTWQPEYIGDRSKGQKLSEEDVFGIESVEDMIKSAK